MNVLLRLSRYLGTHPKIGIYMLITFVGIGVIAVAWGGFMALKRGATLFQRDENTGGWATKKEIKKHLMIVTPLRAEINKIKATLPIFPLMFFISIKMGLLCLWAGFLAFLWWGLSYFALDYYVDEVLRTQKLPPYPEKILDRLKAWFLKIFIPSSNYYYIGKYGCSKVGIPWEPDSGRFLHTLIVGPTDTKKTSTFILPQILNDATSGGSAVVVDAKGELYNMIAQRWLDVGKKVYLFNPWHPDCIGFNLLHYADDQMLKDIVDICMQQREDALKEQDFFGGRTEDFLFNLFKLTQGLDEKYNNLATVYLMVQSVQAIEQFIKTCHKDELKAKFEDFMKMSQGDKMNYLTAIKGKLGIFMDGKVRAAFSKSEFTLDRLFRRGDPCLLIIGCPMDKFKSSSKIISLFSNLIINEAFKQITARQQMQPASKKPFDSTDLYFYGDEGESLQITALPKIVSQARYTHTQILLSITNLDFFKYYHEGFGSLMSNFRTRIYLGGLNVESAEYVSRELGKVEKEQYKYWRHPIFQWTSRQMVGWVERPLMKPDEVKNLPLGQAIVFTRYTRPFVAKVKPAYKIKSLKRQMRPLKRSLRELYKEWGFSGDPLTEPELPKVSFKFYDQKKMKGKGKGGEGDNGAEAKKKKNPRDSVDDSKKTDEKDEMGAAKQIVSKEYVPGGNDATSEGSEEKEQSQDDGSDEESAGFLFEK